MYKNLKLTTIIDFASILKCINVGNTIKLRNYSVYNPNYIKPVCSPDQQQALIESGEAEKLKHVPIKAARHEETSSVFRDIVVCKFLNYMMKGGNKAVVRSVLDRTFVNIKIIQLEKFNKAETLEEKSKIITDPVRIMKMAIANCRPLLKLTPIKKGGSVYQVPTPLSPTKATFKAMRWIILACREKDGKEVKYCDKLAWELIDASQNKGIVVKQKLDLHKQCEANRAYAHFRWS